MKVLLSLSTDAEHGRALTETGYWGRAGAGCMVRAQDTGRYLLPLRSKRVQDPLTWGTWGGAIDANEDAGKAALRELQEEAKYKGEVISVKQLYVFRDKTFQYTTFLVTVPHEFKPELNWETLRSKWFNLDSFPSNLHKGLKAIMSDPNARKLLRNNND